MQNNQTTREGSVGEMRKTRETMADGRRYIIFYTFENVEETAGKPPDETESKTSTLKDRMSSPMFQITDDTGSKTEENENV